MSDEIVKRMIDELFTTMEIKVKDIIANSRNSEQATRLITEYISSSVAAESLGYMSLLYSHLSKKTLSENVFKDPANANKFYELGLRKKLVDAYEFDIDSVASYKSGIDFNEINRVYTAAGAAVGSAAVSGILLGVLNGVVDIPIVVIIAGAVLAAIGGGSITFFKVVPDINKQRFDSAVDSFMKELKESLLNWVDDVTNFYNREVEELKKTL